jgi:hypothetical protein
MMMDPKMDPKAVESPYSEMTLNLETGVWENRFPTTRPTRRWSAAREGGSMRTVGGGNSSWAPR